MPTDLLKHDFDGALGVSPPKDAARKGTVVPRQFHTSLGWSSLVQPGTPYLSITSRVSTTREQLRYRQTHVRGCCGRPTSNLT